MFAVRKAGHCPSRDEGRRSGHPAALQRMCCLGADPLELSSAGSRYAAGSTRGSLPALVPLGREENVGVLGMLRVLAWLDELAARTR